jgi:hypothetical protein
MLDTVEGLKRVGSVCFIMCSLFASIASLFLDDSIKNSENESHIALKPKRPLIRPVTLSKIPVKSKRFVY